MSLKPTYRFSEMLWRGLKYGLIGAALGGVAGWLMFGGVQYNAATGNYGWGLIMAPTFALIGGTLGVVNSLLASAWRALDRSSVNPLNRPRASYGEVNNAEWENPSNWFAGLFYRSRVDTRTFVPKRAPSSWYTINLGAPLGVAIAMVLGIVLIATIFSMVSRY